MTQEHPPASTKLQDAVPSHQPLSPDLAWVAPTLFTLLLNPLTSDPATYGSLIVLRLGRIISTTLPASQRIPVRRAMQALLGQLPTDVFAAASALPCCRTRDRAAFPLRQRPPGA